MKFAADAYVLSSGRRLYANNGRLSLDAASELAQGYDGSCCVQVDGYWVDADSVLTAEEKAEIATEMVKRWEKWGGLL